MMFYRIDAVTHETDIPEDRKEQRAFALTLQSKTERYYRAGSKKICFFIASVMPESVTAGIITAEKLTDDSEATHFLRQMDIDSENITVTEITFKEICTLLRTADINDYIHDDDETLALFGLDNIIRNHSLSFREKMFCAGRTKEQLKSDAKRCLCEETMSPEIDRIWRGPRACVKGHPVHYIICTDSRDTQEKMIDLLISSLLAKDRLESGRACRLEESDDTDDLDRFYASCSGGTVLIRFAGEEQSDTESVSRPSGDPEALCAAAKKHRNRVLTVFLLPTADERRRTEILELLGGLPVVTIRENSISPASARSYLRRRAKEAGIHCDSRLLEPTADPDRRFTSAELERTFSEWYDRKLRTSVYPQYADVAAACTTAPASRSSGSAYNELRDMIGLEEAKKVIERALCFFKAQRIYADKGIPACSPAMHMVLTGNPGTAKTTVARLFARIMKDNGLLATGELIEVGRADLVGKYVGWTAKIVKGLFRRARGGVLFIDEAYSLLDGKEGMYGDEAINTIVQEMENCRGDTVVIFAGYPDRMEDFLQRNPGLRSRIAFHVPFCDYSPAELCDIAEHIAGKKGLRFTEAARGRLLDVFGKAVLNEDFGNGRYARNVVEQAQMEQAVRLVAMDYESVTGEDAVTLMPEDITELPQGGSTTAPRLGF